MGGTPRVVTKKAIRRLSRMAFEIPLNFKPRHYRFGKNWPWLLNEPFDGKLWLVVDRGMLLVARGAGGLFEAAFGAGGSLAFWSINDHRFPFKPDCGFHFKPGTNMIDAMLGPLIEAVPHSVSTVINLTSVAPVIESPLSMTTVVVASLADANLMPATSDNGILAVPNEVCIWS